MFFKLKLISFNLLSSFLLVFFLCLGSQNLKERHSLNFLAGKSVTIPNGFIVGISFTLGTLVGGITSTLLTDIKHE